MDGWLKLHRLKRINKECDKYFKIRKKLIVQSRFIDWLIDKYKETYGEDLRIRKERE